MSRTIVICVTVVLGAALAGVSAVAQAQSFPQPPDTPEDFQAEVFGGVSDLYAKPAYNFRHYNLIGWNVSATQWANSWFGMMVDVSAYYHAVSLPSAGGKKATNVDQYSFLAGPRFRLLHKSRFSASVEPMVGSGLGHAPLPIHTELGTGYEARWAYQLGLAGDYNITPHLAVTLRPAVYFTRFGPSTQTDWKLSAGVVYRFSKSGD